MKISIQPDFDFSEFQLVEQQSTITPDMVRESEREAILSTKTQHSQILEALLAKVEVVDFKSLAFPNLHTLEAQLKETEAACLESPNDKMLKTKISNLDRKVKKCVVNQKHLIVLSIEQVLKLAKNNQWDICRNHDFFYLFNGEYWSLLDKEELQTFLGKAAEKMGVEIFTARFYQFRESLFRQFLCESHLSKPVRPKHVVLINLINGTFEITPNGSRLRPFDPRDFLTYQLPFEYQLEARCPKFENYLNRVLLDEKLQFIMAEYLGYLFTRNLKLEKCLLLYGSGANGKSVFFEIINALLGRENVSNYSLANLGEEHNRAQIANVLINYGSEIKGNIESDIFKQMVSGEPLQARLKYGNSFTMINYARLCFNCNELPRDVEHTEAYFRRFLIIPFNVTIPENERDPELANKIINTELSGIFNWILAGLNRLLLQRKFTESEVALNAINQYKKESDSVYLFIDETNYKKSTGNYMPLNDIYFEYRFFCSNNGYRAVSNVTLSRRLRALNFELEKKNIGQVVWLERMINSVP